MTIEHQQTNETIGTRIQALRISLGIKQSAIAEVIGSKINRVTRVENGKSELSAAELVAVARVLGVKTSVIVGEEEYSGVAS